MISIYVNNKNVFQGVDNTYKLLLQDQYHINFLIEGGVGMNWAAVLTFLHPLLTMIVCSAWILLILKKEYKPFLDEEHFNAEKNN